MNQDQLNELTALLERATPGPWTWGAKYLCSKQVGEEYKRLATALEPDSPKWCADAALIVALRNHAPALLAAAKRASDLERLREAVEAERACCKAEKIAMLKRSSFDISAMSARIQAAEDKVDAALAKLTTTGEKK